MVLVSYTAEGEILPFNHFVVLTADRNLPWLQLFSLRQGQGKHPVFILSVDFIGVDSQGKGQCAAELPHPSLAQMEVLVLVDMLFLGFSPNGQGIVREARRARYS